ncbi:MAG: 2Fe-2S iron-sulfur cluster-binding protein [Trueperaceae bacterium]
MPRLTIDDIVTTVPEGKRLVLAIEEAGVDVGHRCGGNARCTTCRVVFTEGEPDTMTLAEARKLREKDLVGAARLSCQIVADRDMAVRPLMTLESEGWSDTGPQPAEEVMPEATFYPREEALGSE